MCRPKTSKTKVINDPVYGFVRIGDTVAQELINHNIFQRLRRIVQMGTASFAYPGAMHTRFHHSIGAYHLMGVALDELDRKNAHILSEEERKAASYAILLHDIGHGPFSHTLEKQFLKVSHETISLELMEKINQEMKGVLSLAIRIYKGEYEKKFLCELVHGELDVDRLDYLARDCFYTGVVEGGIGYDRILKMIDVEDNKLVVEEKGRHSIENFLMARHFMYQQVYHHKTAVCTEQMLVRVVRRVKELFQRGRLQTEALTRALSYFLSCEENNTLGTESIHNFLQLDDADVWQLLKLGQHHEDKILSLLSNAILARKLFKVMVIESEKDLASAKEIEQSIRKTMCIEDESENDYLAFMHKTSQTIHQKDNQSSIMIKEKRGEIKPIASYSIFLENAQNTISKQYFCYLDS